jgi:hypothetical protein
MGLAISTEGCRIPRSHRGPDGSQSPYALPVTKEYITGYEHPVTQYDDVTVRRKIFSYEFRSIEVFLFEKVFFNANQ